MNPFRGWPPIPGGSNPVAGTNSVHLTTAGDEASMLEK